MFCSTVIPTIGRDSLSRAVQSVLDQEFIEDDSEIIVVNDSGRPLEQAEWQESERIKIINTIRRERCVARNTGAAIAGGKYLHFLDDDDSLVPGAMNQFWKVAQTSNAGLVYGKLKFVDADEKLITEHHIGLSGNGFVQVIAGEWIPIQASIIIK